MPGVALVMVVEDEPLTLMMMEVALLAAGYDVIAAANGDGAIALFDENVDEVAALVTDIELGDGPDGWDVAIHARGARRDLPLVYVTAKGAAEWNEKGVPGSLRIDKPFQSGIVVAKVSKLLGEISARASGARSAPLSSSAVADLSLA
jgi:DNA-binding response OmpR family regulator